MLVLFGGGTESCLWRDDSDSNLTVNRCQLGEGIDTQRSAADDRSSAGRHRGSGASSQDPPKHPNRRSEGEATQERASKRKKISWDVIVDDYGLSRVEIRSERDKAKS